MHPVLTRTCPRDVVMIRWLHLEKEEWNSSPIAGLIFSKMKKYVYVLNLSKRKVNRIRVFFPFAELKSPKSIVKNPTHNLAYCTLKTVFFLWFAFCQNPGVGQKDIVVWQAMWGYVTSLDFEGIAGKFELQLFNLEGRETKWNTCFSDYCTKRPFN